MYHGQFRSAVYQTDSHDVSCMWFYDWQTCAWTQLAESWQSCNSLLQFFGSSFASGVRISRRKSSEPSPHYPEQLELCGMMFDSWSQSEQVHFVQTLLLRMCHQQHGQIDAFLKPMLQRDFISSLPGVLSLWHGRLWLVLLRYPKPTPKPRFFAETVRRRNLGFSAIIDGFWAHLHAKII